MDRAGRAVRNLLRLPVRGVLPRHGLGRGANRRHRVAVGGRILGAVPAPHRAGGPAARARRDPRRLGRRPDRRLPLAPPPPGSPRLALTPRCNGRIVARVVRLSRGKEGCMRQAALAVLIVVVVAVAVVVSPAGAVKTDKLGCPTNFTRITPQQGVELEGTQL